MPIIVRPSEAEAAAAAAATAAAAEVAAAERRLAAHMLNMEAGALAWAPGPDADTPLVPAPAPHAPWPVIELPALTAPRRPSLSPRWPGVLPVASQPDAASPGGLLLIVLG